MEQLYVEKYFKDENSKWIVFLHGFGGNTGMWFRQIRFFKDKFNLLLIDFPGHGQSDSGIAGKGIRRFEEIGDIVVDVLKENHIEKAIFVGVSLGTMVVGGIMSKHTEMVKGAILCGPIMGINAFVKCVLKFFNKIKQCFPYMFLMETFSRFLLPFKSHQFSRKLFMKSGELLGKEEFMEWCDLFVADMDILKNMTDWTSNLLFITGDEDYTFIKGVKQKCKTLPEAKLQIISDCGHVCNIQKWREFNEMSLEFILNMS